MNSFHGHSRFAVGLGLAVCLFGLGGMFAPELRAQNRLQPLDNAQDPVMATVDGAPILRSDVTDFQKSLPPQYQKLPLQMLYPALLDKLIEIKLISEAGQKAELGNDDEVKRRLEQFRERVIEEVYLQRIIEKSVTDDALRQRYDKYIKDTPARQEISARHILLQTESEAKDVLDQIKKGADFADLARARSIDPSAKEQGGDLGFFTRDEMVPEFSNAAFKLKDGEVSAAPVKTQYGWHIIKVEAHRTTAPPFEQMREKLAFDMSTEIKNDIVAKLRKTAKIERFNLDGSAAK
ncbi:MAG TPA: peptidylprolyl isomerase [Alphaproteobacteria bacterium]